MEMGTKEGGDDSLAIRYNDSLVVPSLRKQPKGNVDGHVLRCHSRLRESPGNLTVSNILPAVFAGLESRSSRDGKSIDAYVLG